MLWLAHHNLEIDWKIGKVKMTRCLEEHGKQWRPKQGKNDGKNKKKKRRRKKKKRNKKRRRRKNRKRER